MTPASSRTRILAEDLVAFESGWPFKTGVPGGGVACEKLGPHLSTLMGNVGFTALLTRALKLASAEVPCLGAVQVKVDGTFEGLEGLAAQFHPHEAARGGVMLLAQMIALLTSLVGEDLPSPPRSFGR